MTKRLPTLDPRPRLADIKKRLADRDQRQATDTRSAAEKWLGDPPTDRSALVSENSNQHSANAKFEARRGAVIDGLHIALPPSMKTFPAELVPLL